MNIIDNYTEVFQIPKKNNTKIENIWIIDNYWKIYIYTYVYPQYPQKKIKINNKK